ncbi:FERM domain-containing protein 1-like [Asterias rubens]|uniref:FERM domain-containing protein 1-like n=1 Tax=Asterias rubens TaxID=7604 RepID=UPI001455235B|nr:FERM domain-containing protein 1-like [Asterias rubens]
MPSKTGGGTPVPAGAGRKYVNVVLLNEEEVPLVVEPKTKVQELYDQVCLLVSVKETQFFWLTVQRDGEHEFMDPKSKISKYAPKGWKTESLKVTDTSGRSIFNVYFRVQLYVEHVSLIKEDLTRHHYYLQLKQNVLSAPVLCREEACFVLASYALQADLGNYAEDTHRGQYFDPRKYFPDWVIKRRGEAYIVKHVPSMHRDQRGTTGVYAQRAFIREASNTIEHVMHFYRLKKTKTEQTPSIWLGISTRGIQLYEDSGEGKYLLCEYSWGIIKRLVLQKKKFELQVEGVADGRKITYYTSSEAKSKHLLRLCKLTHTFQMQTQARVDRAKKRESATEKNKYRESYISGDISWSDLDSSVTTTSFGEISTTKLELQRRSVVSNVSSVTTSGIVSDERSPLEKSLSEVEDEYLFGTGHNCIPQHPYGLYESHHSSMSSGLGEKAQAIKLQGGQSSNRGSAAESSNRVSAAVSETASHRSLPETNPVFNSDLQTMEMHVTSSSTGHSNRQSRNSELGWLSDDEARRDPRTSGSTSSGSRPTSRHLTLIDTQLIQAEIANKDLHTPLLSALCNDRSLLLMQQQQIMHGDDEDDEEEDEDDDETTTQDHSHYTDPESCQTPSSQSSMHEVRASQDLNISLTTLVSHSSIESDMHGSMTERLHATSSSLIISPVTEDYPTRQLTKHQTLNTLNNLSDARRYESRLPFGEGGSDGRIKCQTLPSKINASEQLLTMGRAPVAIKEEAVSLSAPNLSPGPVQNEVPILLS